MYLIGSTIAIFALLLFSLSRSYELSFGILLVLGLGGAGFGTMQSLIVMLVSREEMRGRALGVISLAIGTGPLGLLMTGAVADWLSPIDGDSDQRDYRPGVDGAGGGVHAYAAARDAAGGAAGGGANAAAGVRGIRELPLPVSLSHRPTHPPCLESSYRLQPGTWAVRSALKSLPWFGTRRCSSSWAITKSWNSTS